MSLILLLLLVPLLSILHTFRRFKHLWQKFKPRNRISYKDAACQTANTLSYALNSPSDDEEPEELEENEGTVNSDELNPSLLNSKDFTNLSLQSKISIYNPKTQLTYLIPASSLPYHPESLQIPMSVLDRLCKCALEIFEAEAARESDSRGTVTIEALKPSKMVFYVLEDGSCEVREDGEDVPEEWVRVPERVVDFLADEVVKWVDKANDKAGREEPQSK